MPGRYTGTLGKAFSGDRDTAVSHQSRARVLVEQIFDTIRAKPLNGKGSLSRSWQMVDGSVVHAYVNTLGEWPIVRTWIESPERPPVEIDLNPKFLPGGLAYVPMAVSNDHSDPSLFGWQYISTDKDPQGAYGAREGWWITAVDGSNGVAGNARIVERHASQGVYLDKERGLLNAGWSRQQQGTLGYFVREVYDAPGADPGAGGLAEDRNEVVSAGYTQMWSGRHCAIASLDTSGVGDMLGEMWTLKPWLIPVCGDTPLVVDPYKAKIYIADFDHALTNFNVVTFDEYEIPGFPDVVGALPSSGTGGSMHLAHEYSYSYIYQVGVSQSGKSVFVFYAPVTYGADVPDPGCFLMRHEMRDGQVVTSQETHEYLNTWRAILDSVAYTTSGIVVEPKLTRSQEAVIGKRVTLIDGVYGYCITGWRCTEAIPYSVFERELVTPVNDTFDFSSLVGFCMRDDEVSPITARTVGSLMVTPTREYGALYTFWVADGYDWYEDGRPNKSREGISAESRAHVIESLHYAQDIRSTTTLSGLFGELVTEDLTITSSGDSIMKTLIPVSGGFHDQSMIGRLWQYGHRKQDTRRKTLVRRRLTFYDAHNDVMIYEEWTETEETDILFTAGDEGATHAYRRHYTRKSETVTHLRIGMSPGSPANTALHYQFVTAPEAVVENIIDSPSSYIQIINDTLLINYFFHVEHEPLKLKTMQGQDVRLAYRGLRDPDPNRFRLIFLFSNQDTEGNWQAFTHCGTEQRQDENWLKTAGFPWGVDGRPLAHCFRIGDELNVESIS